MRILEYDRRKRALEASMDRKSIFSYSISLVLAPIISVLFLATMFIGIRILYQHLLRWTFHKVSDSKFTSPSDRGLGDIITPIQPILGLTQFLISNKRMDRAAQEEKLNVIARNAKRLKLLTDDILDVTKIEGQALQLNKELINLSHLISNTVKKIKYHILYRNYEI